MRLATPQSNDLSKVPSQKTFLIHPLKQRITNLNNTCSIIDVFYIDDVILAKFYLLLQIKTHVACMVICRHAQNKEEFGTSNAQVS